jgi:hypothetical protein
MIHPPPNADRLVVRWTIGNVRPRGFEMLRLSVACAFRIFGPATKYVVCVNSLSGAEAKERTGDLPTPVEWREVTRADLPDVLRSWFDDTLIEGMGWKLVPLRTCRECYELALDNDCILWDLPVAMRQWLSSANECLFAEDCERSLGSFDSLCPPGAFNAGIRGLPPGEDLACALDHTLRAAAKAAKGDLQLTAEIEEQGLQAAAISCFNAPLLVTTSEVTICSPFWPRSPELGTCGAHFVGMNATHIPWNYYDHPADLWLDNHWHRHRPALYRKARLPLSTEWHTMPSR